MFDRKWSNPAWYTVGEIGWALASHTGKSKVVPIVERCSPFNANLDCCLPLKRKSVVFHFNIVHDCIGIT